MPAFGCTAPSASASVATPPDLLVADLVAQATASQAALAQRQVNDLVARSMTAARGTSGIDARAADYNTSPTDEKHSGWAAQQTVELRGTDGPRLLDLAAKLQASGLSMASLEWRLSEASERRAHDAATIEAIKALRVRAEASADALDRQVDHLTDVRLDEPPVFRPRPGAVMMAARMAAPEATAVPEEVSAEVSADVLLRPCCSVFAPRPASVWSLPPRINPHAE